MTLKAWLEQYASNNSIVILLLRHSLYGSCEVEPEGHASVPLAMNEKISEKLVGNIPLAVCCHGG